MSMKEVVHFINLITRLVNSLSIITLFVIMGLTVFGIFFRFLGVPISGITNLSESLLVIAIYFSIAYAQQKKQHVAVEFLIGSMNAKNRKYLNIINVIISLLITCIIIYASWGYALQSWEIKEKMDGAPFYPIYPPKIIIAVGMTLLGIQLLGDLIREIFQVQLRSKNSA